MLALYAEGRRFDSRLGEVAGSFSFVKRKGIAPILAKNICVIVKAITPIIIKKNKSLKFSLEYNRDAVITCRITNTVSLSSLNLYFVICRAPQQGD